MECNGRRCPMQNGFEVEKCEMQFECPYFAPKVEQKSADYYDGFNDACHFIMATLKSIMERD